MTNDMLVGLVDTLMGLLSSEMDCAPADWSGECLRRSRRAYDACVRAEDDGAAAWSGAVAGEIWEALAVGRPASLVVDNLDESARHYVFPSWGCPYCVDDDGDPVVLDFLGHGEWVCPSCGCHTVSPYDDACVPLIEMDADAAGGDCHD